MPSVTFNCHTFLSFLQSILVNFMHLFGVQTHENALIIVELVSYHFSNKTNHSDSMVCTLGSIYRN